MASSHNEAIPEAAPSEAVPQAAPTNDIFPDTEESNTNVTPVKKEEENPGPSLHDYPPPIDAHIKQEEDDVEMPPSPPPSPRALLHDYPPPIDAHIK